MRILLDTNIYGIFIKYDSLEKPLARRQMNRHEKKSETFSIHGKGTDFSNVLSERFFSAFPSIFRGKEKKSISIKLIKSFSKSSYDEFRSSIESGSSSDKFLNNGSKLRVFHIPFILLPDFFFAGALGNFFHENHNNNELIEIFKDFKRLTQ